MGTVTDSRVQELRRRVAQGEPGARVQLLVERLRIGDLNRENLEIAAHCLDDDARTALGWDQTDFSITALAALGREVAVRAGIAAARLLLCRRPNEVASAAIGAAEAWVTCPCEMHAQAARDLSHATVDRRIGLVAFAAGSESSDSIYAALGPVQGVQSLLGHDHVRRVLHEVAFWALGEEPIRPS